MQFFNLKDFTPSLLAITIIGLGFYVLINHPDLKSEMVAVMMVVINFYFGSSSGSREKDNTIAEAIKCNANGKGSQV